MLSGRSYQLMQVLLDESLLAFIPEMSANKYMLWVRFTQQDGDLRPKSVDADIPSCSSSAISDHGVMRRPALQERPRRTILSYTTHKTHHHADHRQMPHLRQGCGLGAGKPLPPVLLERCKQIDLGAWAAEKYVIGASPRKRRRRTCRTTRTARHRSGRLGRESAPCSAGLGGQPIHHRDGRRQQRADRHRRLLPGEGLALAAVGLAAPADHLAECSRT